MSKEILKDLQIKSVYNDAEYWRDRWLKSRIEFQRSVKPPYVLD